jgi:hypothetical protein
MLNEKSGLACFAKSASVLHLIGILPDFVNPLVQNSNFLEADLKLLVDILAA